MLNLKKNYIDRVYGCFPRQIENSCQRDNYLNLQNRPQFLFLEVYNKIQCRKITKNVFFKMLTRGERKKYLKIQF